MSSGITSKKNQFPAVIRSITQGRAYCEVVMEINSIKIKGMVSEEYIKELGIRPGMEVVASFKASEVMLGCGYFRISAENQFDGCVESIARGSVNSILAIGSPIGTIYSTVSTESILYLGLRQGDEVTAIINSNAVFIEACPSA